MAHEVIEKYLDEILKPQLAAAGAPDDFSMRILGTVRRQMESFIYHWFDEEFRKAILIIGSDEGLFYKPSAPDDIRNFVVVTIRNSEIECLHSDYYRQYGLKERFSEEAIKAVTSAAIEYFVKLDFEKLSDESNKPDDDFYDGLADKYPIATQVLMELAGAKDLTHEFEKIRVRRQLTLDELPVLAEKQSASNVSVGKIIKAYNDGYSFSIGADAKAHLIDCAENQSPFLVDSFKALTRNIDKLMLIMEFLFSRWTPLVTTNFLISNGHIERRPRLLKAGHTHEEMMRNWRNTDGLGKYHKMFLDKAVEQNRS